jgi:hypothetical protein
VFALLIVAGVAGRFLIETPNFKPIAALALFGGFYFRKPSFAVAAVMLMMCLSDFRIGSYSLPLMIAVYLSLALSVWLGFEIRRRSSSGQIGWQQAVGFAGASIIMSIMFFVLTNSAVWWTSAWYPATLIGLGECYSAGLPFFRWTVQGDLFFTVMTVGSYAAVRSFVNLSSRSIETAPVLS